MKNNGCIIIILLLLSACVQNNSDAIEVKIEASGTSITLDSAKSNAIIDSSYSKITCPDCKHSEFEKLPTEICLLKYNCKNCFKEIVPKEGDCCVFCSYGNVKCPSKQ